MQEKLKRFAEIHGQSLQRLPLQLTSSLLLNMLLSQQVTRRLLCRGRRICSTSLEK